MSWNALQLYVRGPLLDAGNVQMVKKPKAEGATDTIPAAMPASSTDASEGSTTPSTGAIPAFLQAGQVSTCAHAPAFIFCTRVPAQRKGL